MDAAARADALELAEGLVTDIELDRLARQEAAWLFGRRRRHQVLRATKRGTKENPTFGGSVQLGPFARTLEAELAGMKLPNLSGDMVALAIRETRNHVASVRNQVLTINSVLAAVSMLVHDFAARQYYALRFTTRQDNLFERATTSIESLLSELDAEALQKVDSAQANLLAGDPEAVAGAMLSVRRLIDGFADAVSPPSTETRLDPQGQTVRLGAEQRLNRIRAFWMTTARAQPAARA